ncbi:group I truncated hemoglobin [Thalassobellus suaedae]|uniref:Group 1 truncated hemoglobin n=1 Tax=Thalassobellus suaedae TaxID=3074124 RepID=A0ABY9Y5U6_9FLAO|nr:group 1 truncated hemoglobin [Flavobacteriaceae bacterium HL-DH10]
MNKTLFERLGGRNGISKIVDDTVENHMNNPAVNARFMPFKEKPEQLAIIKSHTVDFFSAGSGGPNDYKGKDMVTAHTGMNISHAEYMHVMDDIVMALDKNNIDEDSKKDVLSILWSLKGMMIGK